MSATLKDALANGEIIEIEVTTAGGSMPKYRCSSCKRFVPSYVLYDTRDISVLPGAEAHDWFCDACYEQGVRTQRGIDRGAKIHGKSHIKFTVAQWARAHVDRDAARAGDPDPDPDPGGNPND